MSCFMRVTPCVVRQKHRPKAQGAIVCRAFSNTLLNGNQEEFIPLRLTGSIQQNWHDDRAHLRALWRFGLVGWLLIKINYRPIPHESISYSNCYEHTFGIVGLCPPRAPFSVAFTMPPTPRLSGLPLEVDMPLCPERLIAPHCPSSCASACSAWGSQKVMSMAWYRSMAALERRGLAHHGWSGCRADPGRRRG
jgi:hypothetical protein